MTTAQPNRYHNMGFDPDELRDKYLAERDKRIRKDGNEQYQNMSDHFAHYLDDPYVEPGYEREPHANDRFTVIRIQIRSSRRAYRTRDNAARSPAFPKRRRIDLGPPGQKRQLAGIPIGKQ